MKKLCLFLFVCLLSFGQVLGQGFPLIYSQAFGISPKATIELPQGDFISICTVKATDSAPVNQKTAFLKFDNNGAVFEYTEIETDQLIAVDIALDTENNVLALCTKYMGFDTKYPVVYKFSQSGELIWSRDYPYHEDFQALDILVLENNDFVISSTNYDPIIDDRSVIMRCSPQAGDTIWSQEFVAIGSEYGNELRCDTDGNILVVGLGSPSVFSNTIGFIRKVSLAGESIWHHTLAAPDTNYSFNDIYSEGGEYFIAGKVNPDSISANALLMVINDSGDELWSNTYGGENSDSFENIQRFQDGRFALSGNTYSFEDQDDPDTYLVYLNSDYSIFTETSFGGAESEFQKSSFITSDEQLLLTGNTRSFNEVSVLDTYISLLDANGSMVTSIDEPVIQSEGMTVFPNPTSIGDDIRVQFKTNDLWTELSLFNLLGELVYSYQLYGQSREVNIATNDLSSGQYILQLNSDKTQLSERITIN